LAAPPFVVCFANYNSGRRTMLFSSIHFTHSVGRDRRKILKNYSSAK